MKTNTSRYIFTLVFGLLFTVGIFSPSYVHAYVYPDYYPLVTYPSTPTYSYGQYDGRYQRPYQRVHYGYPYQQYQSYQYGYNYSPLLVSCYADIASAQAGTSVRWNAYVSGGNGSYSYSWVGSDGLPNLNQATVNAYYPYAGTKVANVTVWSDGQVVTRYCGSVNVYTNYYYY